MNWKGHETKRSCSHLRYYLGIYLEGLRKTKKAFSQDSLSPDGDLNPRPSKYEAGVLTTKKLEYT
jgi:hypothetical protein